MNGNWPGNNRASGGYAPVDSRRWIRAENRRWDLLASRHKLPLRAQDAIRDFHAWSQDSWWDAQLDNERMLFGREQLNPHSPGWAAYLSGGAQTLLKVFDLPAGNVPEFVATASFVCDSELRAADARLIRKNLIAHELSRDHTEALDGIRATGVQHATWWVERKRQKSPQPRIWQATQQREIASAEPIRFLDLVAAEWAGLQHRIQ
jgi:hypothetical protein